MNAASYEDFLSLRPLNVRLAMGGSTCALVSGHDVAAVARERGAIAMAANVRNPLSALGVLMAAREADSFVMLELAKSEATYTGVTFDNLPAVAAAYSKQIGDHVPFVLHMDHYAIKSPEDRDEALGTIPRAIRNGWTSVAVDASHNPDYENLIFTRDVAMHIPGYVGLEVEVGEIKGAGVLTTVEEAEYFVGGLNSWAIFPDFLAISNGSKHGTYDSSLGEAEGIDLDRTGEVSAAISKYGCVIAQHGISGTPLDKVGRFGSYGIHKGNVGTLWQNIVFGLDLDPDSGNAFIENGSYVKRPDRGVPTDLWNEMVAWADSKGYPRSSGDYKKANRPFHDRIMSLPDEYRNRILDETKSWALRFFEAFHSLGTGSRVIDRVVERGDYNAMPESRIVSNREDYGPERAPDHTSGGVSGEGVDHSD
ncbi:class II fructose-bisphosphate aldolase [Candidatus Fermentibacterales bacterium]|nr:class II fructose-bisphosphate aldolase [Candidatus Fermentibacterales bacterium]